MPIVASRADEIRRRIAELGDPKTRARAILRLKALGPRVPPHVEHGLVRMAPEVRAAIAEVLRYVDTADARAILRRLVPGAAEEADDTTGTGGADTTPRDLEGEALNELRALPPPRTGEAASVSRKRGEAHLLLARAGSRLARKDLLTCLAALGADRGRLYCEAAALIGDAEFVPMLAGYAAQSAACGAGDAIGAIAARERLTARSKAIKELEPSLRAIAVRAIAARADGTKA
jgi:hypothetical protein